MSAHQNRFDGLAQTYGAHRPSYPAELFDDLRRLTAGAPHRAFIDIGCGTGISTRQLATALRDWTALGMEPGEDMLRNACQHGRSQNIFWLRAAAEALPIRASSAGLVTVAQALHWFDRPRFYKECRFALAPGGVLAVIYNNRDLNSPLMNEIEEFMERENLEYRRDYRNFDIEGELATATGFEDAGLVTYAWQWKLDANDFAGYFLSRSWMTPITKRRGKEAVSDFLMRAAEPFAAEGFITMKMQSCLYFARRTNRLE